MRPLRARSSSYTPHLCSCSPTSFVGCVLASWSTRTNGWKQSRWLQCSHLLCFRSCGFMCAHCAAEHFITSLQHGIHCNICSKEVRGWAVRQQDGSADGRVEAAAPTLWRQHPQLRNRPVHVERWRVEMQLLYHAVDNQPPETMLSVFSVCDGEEKCAQTVRARRSCS